MLWCWSREQRVAPERLVINERFVVTCRKQFARLRFKPHCPVEWLNSLLPPCVGVQVVYDVAAANDEHPFVAQRREPLCNVVMKFCWLRLVVAREGVLRVAVPEEDGWHWLGHIQDVSQRLHVNDEAVMYIALDGSVVSLVNLLDGNHLDVRCDVVFGAVIEHLLCFADAANE